ncbi:MAG: TIGR00282 family metallophosphoesterase [Sedimentisphaerales bacterium]|nr:TIGR00282 family metallophosphoesterase [Sedimentisphaerales bacterium]
MHIRLLCIGDIVGRPGRQILSEQLGALIKEYQIDCTIVNAENAAGGSGLTPAIYDKLLKYGVNLITLGDHIYRKRDIIPVLQNSADIVRPANLSPQAAGREWAVFTTARGPQVAVFSLLGRMFMPIPSENPFHTADRILGKIPPEVKTIVVDVHAEATSEKIALGRFLDGRVSVVFGTHTHVTTADETLLPQGSAYITDLGMTGPHDSVLGRRTDRVIKSLVTQMPCPYSIATDDLRLNAVVVDIDTESGRASRIERIRRTSQQNSDNPYDADDGRPGNLEG